jgi:hypothetical protein
VVTSAILTVKAIIWTNSSEAAAEINRPTILFKEIEVMASEICWDYETIKARHRTRKNLQRRLVLSQ